MLLDLLNLREVIMNKRKTVEEIARCASGFHVADTARKALRGEVSLDRALHETAKHSTTFYVKNIAEKAIDKGANT